MTKTNENTLMPVPTRHRRRVRPVMALVIAGLMGATALTAATALSIAPAQAEGVFNGAPAKGFADLVEKVMPAVISVEVRFAPASDTFDTGRRRVPELSPGSPFYEFFNQRRGRRFHAPRRRGQGSGFIVSEDGYAVTNNHVIRNASEVTVKLNDGATYTADVIGVDTKTDLALLKIKADRKFEYVSFSDKNPRVGDWVVAVGNPFGLGGTVTTGVISARGRNIGSGPYDDYLQIDAPINRGNSGGPAFNLQGEVIGINTAIYTPSGGSVGIGFAIPATTAKAIIEDLKDDGVVTRGWLGVSIQNVTAEIAKSIGLDKAAGALVADVTADSPALRGGIHRGDTIVAIGDTPIKSSRDLAVEVARLKPGSTATFKVWRKGKERVIDVKIGTMPGSEKASARSSRAKAAHKYALGVQLSPAEDGSGVVVQEVIPGSPAQKARLRRGDVILEVAGIEVNQPAAVKAALDKAAKKGDAHVLILVRTGERQRYVAVKMSKAG